MFLGGRVFVGGVGCLSGSLDGFFGSLDFAFFLVNLGEGEVNFFRFFFFLRFRLVSGSMFDSIQGKRYKGQFGLGLILGLGGRGLVWRCIGCSVSIVVMSC